MIALFVLYGLGLLAGVFLMGAGYIEDGWEGWILFWPVAVAIMIVVAPLIGLYRLGMWWRWGRKRPESIDEGW